jgi:hypothetical protein
MKRFAPYIFRGLLSGGALLFGVLVVGLSLQTSVPVYSQESDRASLRQLYFDGEILPDHLFYPALMVADRLQITLAGPDERVYLQVLFAYQRLESSRLLLEKGEEALALTTLTKSQKYLLGAAHGVLGLDEAGADGSLEEAREHILKAFRYHLREYALLQDEFKELDTSAIGRLIEEGRVLEMQLADE